MGLCARALARAGRRRCSASSRPAAPTCRSTRPTRASGSPSCSADAAACRCSSPRRGSPRTFPRSRRAVVLLERRGHRRAGPAPRPRGGSRERRLRDLHLGLDRPAQGRGGAAPGPSSTCSPPCSASSRPARADAPAGGDPAARSTSPCCELFLPLTVGATVVLAHAGTASDGARLRRHPGGAPASRVMQATAATWQLLLEAGWAATPGLTACSCGGEALPRELAAGCWTRGARLLERLRPDRDDHLVAGCADRRRGRRPPVPVGRPLAEHARLRPRRAGAEPVPVGRAGRAVHRRRGPGARLPRPAGADGRALRPRPVLRRAGRAPLPHRRPRPLARRRRASSSSAASTTRSRSAASASSWARSRRACSRTRRCAAAAAAATTGAGGRRLVAYVVPVPGRGRSPRELRACAAPQPARVHGARRPSCALAALPLTPNGKVDRRALPDAGGGERRRGGFRAASDAGRGAPGRDLGRGPGRRSAVGRPRRLLRARRPLAARHPGGLAPARGARRRAAAARPVRGAHRGRPRRARRGRAAGPGALRRRPHRPPHADGPAPLSFAQERLWFLDQLDPGQRATTCRSALRLRGALDVRALRGASPRSCAATRRCAPPSPPRAASPSR